MDNRSAMRDTSQNWVAFTVNCVFDLACAGSFASLTILAAYVFTGGW